MTDYFNQEQQALIDELADSADKKAALRELLFCAGLSNNEGIQAQLSDRIGVPAYPRELDAIKENLIESIRRAHTAYPHVIIKNAETLISALSDHFKANPGNSSELASLGEDQLDLLQAFVDLIRQESIR